MGIGCTHLCTQLIDELRRQRDFVAFLPLQTVDTLTSHL